MSASVGLIIGLVLLVANIYFVAAEFALISARRAQIEPAARAGSRTAAVTLRALENVTLMMAAAQLGITACTIGLGAVTEPALAGLIEKPLDLMHLPTELGHPIAFAIALAVVVTVHVVIGEMVPKNVALAAPERSARILAPSLVVIVTVLRPLVWLVNGIANLSVRALRIEPQDEVSSTYTADEVADIIEESHGEGLLDDQAHDLVSGALSLSRTVESVLLSMSTVRSVRLGCVVSEVEDVCAETGFSRFPVVRDGREGGEPELIGYLHIKDVLETDPERRHRRLEEKWVRPMPSVLVGSDLRSAFGTMRQRDSHLAKVVDQHGVLQGIVALEDILEELVGEIRDATQRVVGQSSSETPQPK